MLVIPLLERRILQTVSEEVTAESVHTWPEQSLQFCLHLLQKIREGIANRRQMLEAMLAEGVEARSFARNHGSLLPVLDDQLGQVRGVVERLAAADDPVSESLGGELRLLEQEIQTFRNLMSEALSRASAAPRPVDWDRVRAAEEAHGRGETRPFSAR
jgi:hypothetical protein